MNSDYVSLCCAVPLGERTWEQLHNRCCIQPLRADKTHLGPHMDRKGNEWANTLLPIVVPERRAAAKP